MRYECRHCGSKNYWKLGSREYRCKTCKKDFRIRLVSGIILSRRQWIEIIDLFLLGVNSPIIKSKLGKSMGTISKALRVIRICMTTDVLRIFSGTVEVDETYLSG